MAGNKLFKVIKHNRELKKIDDYVNKPNEVDIQIKQFKKTQEKHGKDIEGALKDIVILKEYSHPSQEYICCRKCGCEIAKSKTKKRR